MCAYRFRCMLALACVAPGLIFSPVLLAQQSSFSADFDAPLIRHNEPDREVAAGAQAISATVSDNVGVDSVVLHYREIGEPNYKSVSMSQLGGSDVYMVTLASDEAPVPGIEYYIEARDASGNTVLKGFPISPLTLSIAQTTAPPVASGSGRAPAPLAPPPDEQSDSSSGNKWLWIGLGVLALGGLAAASSGGGGGGGGGNDDSVDLTITANPPE